jgi:hypothetical protein
MAYITDQNLLLELLLFTVVVVVVLIVRLYCILYVHCICMGTLYLYGYIVFV